MERDAWKSKGYKSKWRRASWNGESGPFFLEKVKKVIREEEWQLRLILLQRAVCSPAKGKSPALTTISSCNALSIYVTDRHLAIFFTHPRCEYDGWGMSAPPCESSTSHHKSWGKISPMTQQRRDIHVSASSIHQSQGNHQTNPHSSHRDNWCQDFPPHPTLFVTLSIPVT